MDNPCDFLLGCLAGALVATVFTIYVMHLAASERRLDPMAKEQLEEEISRLRRRPHPRENMKV